MSQHVSLATRQICSTLMPIRTSADILSLGHWEGCHSVHNRVLIIRSEPALTSELLIQTYRDRGYSVEVVTARLPREDILRAAGNSQIAVVELRSDDSSMFELCEYLRAHWTGPLLILTSAFANADVVRVYQMGADGHYPYPCNMRVVMARTEALLRRSQGKLRIEARH